MPNQNGRLSWQPRRFPTQLTYHLIPSTVSCANPKGYLREPLKRQATKRPGRPGRFFRRSITK